MGREVILKGCVISECQYCRLRVCRFIHCSVTCLKQLRSNIRNSTKKVDFINNKQSLIVDNEI